MKQTAPELLQPRRFQHLPGGISRPLPGSLPRLSPGTAQMLRTLAEDNPAAACEVRRCIQLMYSLEMRARRRIVRHRLRQKGYLQKVG